MLDKQKSHPTWVRGLKLVIISTFATIFVVAPHMGAWIEIRKTLFKII